MQRENARELERVIHRLSDNQLDELLELLRIMTGHVVVQAEATMKEAQGEAPQDPQDPPRRP